MLNFIYSPICHIRVPDTGRGLLDEAVLRAYTWSAALLFFTCILVNCRAVSGFLLVRGIFMHFLFI